MFGKKSNGAIAATLLLAVFLWGASNAASKLVLATWPPIWVGSTRFLCAGFVMLAILKWTPWFGATHKIPAELKKELWLRGGLTLAIYILAFNWAMYVTSATHMALYLGAAPVWALMWEERPQRNWQSAQRYGAALLAATGVAVLLWPALKTGTIRVAGELTGLLASFMWAFYGRQCRRLGATLSGTEVGAHTLWRAGMLLLPLALLEVLHSGIVWRANVVFAQTYCFIGGGVIAYGLWNNALRHWPTSQVFLFNNLIPLTTMLWAWILLREPFTRTFWLAMILIVLGVLLGQARWQKVLGPRWAPLE